MNEACFVFPESAPAANSVFYRTYSRRKKEGGRESFLEVNDRTTSGLKELGKLTEEEYQLIYSEQKSLRMLTSGRWLWVGGTQWIKNPYNYFGGYNCSYNEIYDWRSFGLQMELGMSGCGTGASLEERCISKLPVIRNRLNVTTIGAFGQVPAFVRREDTLINRDGDAVHIVIGDSRDGWVKSVEGLLELTSDETFSSEIDVTVDISHIRPKGATLKGFGGVANPYLLDGLYEALAKITNKAIGRKLTAEECCLLIDTAAKTIVAGSIRRFAGIKIFDESAPLLKLGLWKEVNGKWQIDPDRDALRMSNHTRAFTHKPDLKTVIEAVKVQYQSGEGAILWTGEAVARSNADLLNTPQRKKQFLFDYSNDPAEAEAYLAHLYFEDHSNEISEDELDHRMHRWGLNPCGEIVSGAGFMCNLSEVNLNTINPLDLEAQERAFKAASLSVAALLHHRFNEERVQKSREYDPIVAVCPTGLFDFFVNLFGVDWLRWWEAGRTLDWNDGSEGRQGHIADIANMFPDWYGYDLRMKLSQIFKDLEQRYLEMWRNWVHQYVWEYCDKHGLKRPNRCTAVQPSGSKSLLTNASPGWHPPIAQRFIRRITFRKNDPVALACIDFGYNVVPSQSDKDENGRLLDDPFDPRVTEWLIEIPTSVAWADLPGADKIDLSQFSALAQFDFYMNVQKHYTTHNTSATISLREKEIEELGTRIYQAIQDDEGYISAALLARFDDLETFPRMPFEPIDKETFDRLQSEVLQRRKENDFYQALLKHDVGEKALNAELAPAGCDSDKCILPEKR